MKRNFLLLLAIGISLLFIINSSKKILSLRTTSQRVAEAQEQLEKLKQENEALRKNLEFKRSDQFAEEEIRNKLGLAKRGEAVVIVPKDEIDEKQETKNEKQEKNWRKWWDLFFGS